MPAIQIPGTNIVYGWETREKGWGRGMNTNLLVMGQVARGSVISRQQSIAPSSPEEGDAYIVPEGATGTWSGKDNTIAAYHSGAWLYIEPFGSPVLVVDEDLHIYWNGEGYDVVGGTGDVNGAAASIDGELPAFSGTSGKALKRTPLRLDADGNLWGAGLKVEEVAGTAYSLTAADNGKVLWFTSADPVTVTLPDNATTAIAGGFNVVLVQGGDGVVTAAGEGSDTVISPDNPIVTSGAGTAVSVIKQADTAWWASAGGSGGGGGGSTGANVEVISATSYTISEADDGKVLWFTAATAVTVTMPGTTALPMGTNIEGAIIQAGTGTVTVQGDAESSIAAEGGLVASAAQYAPMSFFRQAANLWWLGGQRA